MKLIGYLVFRFWVFVFSLIPFKILYFLSDGIAYLLSNVIKYRRKLIIKNLKASFPEKTQEELDHIFKESYRNLSDILIEGLKGMSMSPEALQKRYKFNNAQLLQDAFENHKSVIGVAAHLGNWEWATRCIGLALDHQVLGITKRINNPYIYRFVQRKRSEVKVLVADLKDTSKAFTDHIDKQTCFILIADQSPHKVHNSFWIPFLNQMTPFLHGPGTISDTYDLDVFFFPIQRTQRGHYEVNIELLHQRSKAKSPEEIVTIFADRLEQMIIANPEQWLWTHNRWKRAHLYEG